MRFTVVALASICTLSPALALSEDGAQFLPSKKSEGESAERTAIITGVAGGALFVGGAVLFYVGMKRRAEGSPTVSLVLEPDHVGLAIGGSLP